MNRRDFLTQIAGYTTALTLCEWDELLAAAGFHGDGPYNGPLLSTYVHSTCGACPGGCGIRVRQVDGVPVRVDGNPIHPVNRGGLCPVGVSSLALLVHPDRIRQPLKRSGPRGSGEYTPISWSEAEALVRDALADLKSSGQPEGLLFIDGREQGIGLDLARRFVNDFGSPNFYDSREPTDRAAATIWGGEDSDYSFDLEEAKLIFCFGQPVFEAGRNPVYYSGLRGRMLEQPEGARGSFIIIDPRLSASAAKAERWIPIKPGSHGLLALGMIYLIIKEQLYDRSAIENHLYFFEDQVDSRGRRRDGFKTSVLKHYYPAYVSKITGIPVDQIIMLARLFATSPNALAIWGDGVSKTVDGAYQTWAVMALNAVTGRLGSPGGVHAAALYPFRTPAFKTIAAPPLVSDSVDEFPYLGGTGAIESLPEKILAGKPYPVRMAILNGANPVYQSPQANRFRQAMQNIPFSVVMSSMWTETSGLADLVLPDCTYFEKHDLSLRNSDFAHAVVSLTQPVIEPLYESRQVDDVILSLGRELLGEGWKRWKGYADYVEERAREIYDSNAGSLLSDQFMVSFESLLAERGWRRREYQSFDGFWSHYKATGGWWNPTLETGQSATGLPTRSGQFDLVSRPLGRRFGEDGNAAAALLGRAGLHAPNGTAFMLGAYRADEETEDAQFPLKLYPVHLTTLRGEGGRLDKMADMVGYYDYVKWHSWVELNPETAAESGLADGQQVWVESATGKQRLPLVLNPGLVPGVAAVPLGLGKEGRYGFGENLNRIASTARECLTGQPAIADTRVRMYRAG